MSDDIDQEQPFLSHLIELRTRLLRAVIGVLAFFLVLVPFANDLYNALAAPLLAHGSMSSIRPLGPFLAPIKLTLALSFFIAVPWVLYQAWAFVAPGLYRNEKRLVWPLLTSSTLLFYAGMSFAYFVVLPLFSAFITHTAPEGIDVMTDISLYLDFVLTLVFCVWYCV